MSQQRTRREFIRDLGIGTAALPFVLNLPSLGFANQQRRKQIQFYDLGVEISAGGIGKRERGAAGVVDHVIDPAVAEAGPPSAAAWADAGSSGDRPQPVDTAARQTSTRPYV